MTDLTYRADPSPEAERPDPLKLACGDDPDEPPFISVRLGKEFAATVDAFLEEGLPLTVPAFTEFFSAYRG